MMNKYGKILIFAGLSFILGAFAGAAVWVVLRLMKIGIDLLWTDLPQLLGCSDSLIYNLAVCLAGGLVIGLWQKRNGLFPDELTQVMKRIKTEGKYPYDNLHIVAVSALLPLIFGGALGPEAGLTGLIAGLCCFIADRLKYKGDEVAALMETGTAAVLGVVFRAPLFGIANNLEPDNTRSDSKPDKKDEKHRKKLVSKKMRIFVYVMGVAGSILTMMGLGRLFGGNMGLPRFDVHHGMGVEQWKWFIPLIAVGIVFAFVYLLIEKVTAAIGKRLLKYRVFSCMIAGVLIAVIGHFLPLTMFSGEDEMGMLINDWQTYPVALLILSAIGKLLLVNTCINLGWRGGSVFPILFAGVALGFAAAAIVGMDGAFAVAVTAAALYGYIMRKPITVVAVLLLCFPITYIFPLLIAAFVAALMPLPSALELH